MQTQKLRIVAVALTCLVTACGGGEVTRGDLYSACVDGEMRNFDNQIAMVKRLAGNDYTAEDDKLWARERTRKLTEAGRVCDCSADALPDRIAQERLRKVLDFYQANGTTRAKSKYEALTESEQTELIKCGAEDAIEQMRKNGLLD